MLLHVTQKCVQPGVNGVNGHHVLSHVVMVVRHLERVHANLVLTARVHMWKQWAVKQKTNVPAHLNGQTGLIVRLHAAMDDRIESENAPIQAHVRISKWTKQENAIWQIAHVWVNGQNGPIVMYPAVMAWN